jgi:hypothetical protein
MRVSWVVCLALATLVQLCRCDLQQSVHVVVSNHLDIGFHSGYGADVPGTDINVINHYFTEYFPKAIEIAEELRGRDNTTDALKYMTHVSVYIHIHSERLP